MGDKIIKPFYNVRIANNMQRAAADLAEKNRLLREQNEQQTMDRLHEMKGTTFTRLKTKSQMRREANHERRTCFNESLAYLVASAAYRAIPIDGKPQLSDDAQINLQENATFAGIFGLVQERMIKDPIISARVGETYSRYSNLQLGDVSSVAGGQAAAFAGVIASSHNPLRMVKDDFKVSTSQSVVDQLIYFGDTAAGMEKNDGSGALYEEFVEKLSEQVETAVVTALKEEAERVQMRQFLDESYAEDPYAKVSNRNLARQVSKSSVLNEVTMTVIAKAKTEGEWTHEQLMSEAVAQYAVMETLNSIGLLGRTKEEIISECIKTRTSLRRV